jgi:hypothetical protein
MQEQDLSDVLADCTVLTAERDKLLASGGLDHEMDAHSMQPDEIKDSARTLLAQLSAWRTRWDSDSGNSYIETPATFVCSQEPGGNGSSSRLTTFEFSNHSVATMLIFYNTVLIHVLRVLTSIQVDKFSTHPSQSIIQRLQGIASADYMRTDTKDEYSSAERLAALELCRCIPYYLEQKARLNLPHSPLVHFPVATVRTFWNDGSPEGRWMTDLLKTIKEEAVAKAIWAD